MINEGNAISGVPIPSGTLLLFQISDFSQFNPLDSPSLSKDQKLVFWSVRGKIGHVKYEDVHTADFSP